MRYVGKKESAARLSPSMDEERRKED